MFPSLATPPLNIMPPVPIYTPGGERQSVSGFKETTRRHDREVQRTFL